MANGQSGDGNEQLKLLQTDGRWYNLKIQTIYGVAEIPDGLKRNLVTEHNHHCSGVTNEESLVGAERAGKHPVPGPGRGRRGAAGVGAAYEHQEPLHRVQGELRGPQGGPTLPQRRHGRDGAAEEPHRRRGQPANKPRRRRPARH